MSTALKTVIIGSGPAGHTAAVYCARASLEPVLYEGMMAGGIAPGGQLTTTTEIENFPGFPEGIQGMDLTDRLRQQSSKFGTRIETKTISKVDLSARPFKLWCEDEESEAPILAQSLIIATGATAKKLDIPGAEKYWQRGVSACAVCDGALPIFRNKEIVVVGGGDSACEEALHLTKYGSVVHMVVRRDVLRASKAMANRVIANEKIRMHWNSVCVECAGDKLLRSVDIKDVVSGQVSKINAAGLFFAIGHKPNTDFLRDTKVALDSDGYIITTPGTSLTTVEGVFAAGDCQDKRYRQACTAAGSGCMAALDCEKWLMENPL